MSGRSTRRFTNRSRRGQPRCGRGTRPRDAYRSLWGSAPLERRYGSASRCTSPGRRGCSGDWCAKVSSRAWPSSANEWSRSARSSSNPPRTARGWLHKSSSRLNNGRPSSPTCESRSSLGWPACLRSDEAEVADAEVLRVPPARFSSGAPGPDLRLFHPRHEPKRLRLRRDAGFHRSLQ